MKLTDTVELKTILDVIPMGIMVIRYGNGKIQYVNPAFEKMTGYSLKDIKSTDQWFNLAYPDKGYRDTITRRWESVSGTLREGETIPTVIRDVNTKDGSTINMLFNFIGLDDENCLIIMYDVTHEVENEKALIESEKKFRTLTESSSVASMIYNEDGWIYVNPAACNITGYSEDELLDMNIEDVVHPDYKELIKKRAAARLRGEDPLKHYQFRIVSKSGKVKWIDFWADRITYNGKTAVLISVVDITEKKNLEKQLLQSQKMESIGHLVGGIAHDFNNLLTPITMNAEFIEYNSEKDSVIHKQAKSIVQSSKRAKSIIKKLLAFGKKQVMEMKSVDLNSVIEDLMKLLESTISNDIELVLHLSDDIKMIEADPVQIEQILMNLVINAQDAIESNGKISIETSMVDLDIEYASIYTELKQGEYVLLTVSDNGRGMTKEVQTHIFEPFFTTKEQGKGTGLGLSTVYGIVKQHNASINVYSEPEEGSVFKIYFPVKGKEIKKIEETSSNQDNGKTILIVEDNEQILSIARKMLKKKGYTVYSSSNPVHGIKIARKHRDKIDLILSDIVMPEMHGKQMCEEIKKIIPGVKILYMSGYSKEILSEKDIDRKTVNFIPKPFSGRKLIKYIEDILQID